MIYDSRHSVGVNVTVNVVHTSEGHTKMPNCHARQFRTNVTWLSIVGERTYVN